MQAEVAPTNEQITRKHEANEIAAVLTNDFSSDF